MSFIRSRLLHQEHPGEHHLRIHMFVKAALIGVRVQKVSRVDTRILSTVSVFVSWV